VIGGTCLIDVIITLCIEDMTKDLNIFLTMFRLTLFIRSIVKEYFNFIENAIMQFVIYVVDI